MRAMTALVALLPLFLASGSVPAQPRTLSGSEITSWISAATLSGPTSSGREWRAHYKPDGTYRVEALGTRWTDEGTWTVENDTLCTERTKRGRQCMSVTHTGGAEYSLIDDRRQTEKVRKIE
jgi:hypothetical protein